MKNGRLSDDFIDLTTKLMLARERSEIMRIASDFNSTIERLIQAENHTEPAIKRKATTCTLKFTKEEISKVKMATTFKKEFIANGLVAHITKRESGKNSYCYEIRYRSNGFKIEASSTDLTEAKRKFLAKTAPEEIEKYRVRKAKTKSNLLEDLFEEWYNYKNGTITERELKRFASNFNALPCDLRKTPITAIRTVDIDKVMKDVKPRKYEELRTLFNGIFKYAVASGVLANNPISLIKFVKAERQTRDSLSDDEILELLKKLEWIKYRDIRQYVYVLYFFGLRPCEVDEEARREGDFLIARNRKRKNGKIEYKKIPIPSQSHGLIDWEKPLVPSLSAWKLNETMKELLDGKTSYYLRHTFATLCQQYINRPDIVDIWMGDSPTRLVGKHYTHFPDKFMKEQMDLVEFPILQSIEK